MPTLQALSMTHKQTEAAADWVIVHGFGRTPAVNVSINYEGKLQVVLPREVIIDSPNQVTVKFSAPQTGEARLN